MDQAEHRKTFSYILSQKKLTTNKNKTKTPKEQLEKFTNKLETWEEALTDRVLPLSPLIPIMYTFVFTLLLQFSFYSYIQAFISSPGGLVVSGLSQPFSSHCGYLAMGRGWNPC